MDKMLINISRLVIVLFLFSFSCVKYKPISNTFTTTENITMNEVKTYKEMEAKKGNNVYVFGTVVKEEFINKGGHATGNYETLLKLSDGETVHIRNKGEKIYDYDSLLNKKVKMEALVFYGNIDSDNPVHQSRVGYRIDYTTITVVD